MLKRRGPLLVSGCCPGVRLMASPHSLTLTCSTGQPSTSKQLSLSVQPWKDTKAAQKPNMYTEGGRALVSEIHVFLRSHINLLNLRSSSPHSMIIANFFASPGIVPRSADALLVRSWSVPGCGGDGAVWCAGKFPTNLTVICWVCRFALKISETLCLRTVKLRWNLGGTAAFWPY